MTETTKNIHVSVRLTPDDLEQLDVWLESQRIPPTRNQAIATALREFLSREAKKTARKKNG